jgi:hypothetical protein
MNATDEFGHNPDVQQTRAWFSCMEALDAKLIQESGISVFDKRLRPARDMRFKLYEAACFRAAGKRMHLDGDMALELFELCQNAAFQKCGLPVSSLQKPENLPLLSLVKETLQ